jgi:hypothetical protein
MPERGMGHIRAVLSFEEAEARFVRDRELIPIDCTAQNPKSPISGLLRSQIIDSGIVHVDYRCTWGNYETTRTFVIGWDIIKLQGGLFARVVPILSYR